MSFGLAPDALAASSTVSTLSSNSTILASMLYLLMKSLGESTQARALHQA
jgi:hypothetical protein